MLAPIISRGHLCLAAVVLSVAVGVVPSSAAAGEGEELLSKAAAHTGTNEITSGEFRYRVVDVEEPPTKKEIERRTDEIRSLMREQIKKATNEAQRKRLEKAFAEIEETIARQMIANASKTMAHHCLLGDDRYTELSVLNKENDKVERTVVVLQPFRRPTSQLSIIKSDGQTVANRIGVYPGSQEPQQLGRLVGFLVEGLPFVKHVEVVPVEGAAQSAVRGLVCRVDQPRSPVVEVVCHVDPSRGYITPLVRELDAEGEILREWICQHYFRAGPSGLWFPKVVLYQEKPKKPDAMPHTERYEFDPEAVKLNGEIPAERFAVTLERGERLVDAIGGENTNYVAQKELRVSLDDLENLSAIAGLRRVSVGDAVPPRKRP